MAIAIIVIFMAIIVAAFIAEKKLDQQYYRYYN